MKILFIGSSEFSVPALEKIIKENYEIIAVVTQPDKQAGRGKKIRFTPVKEVALKYNLKIFQPENINQDKTIKELKPDLIIVVAYGGILKKEILNSPKYGCINLHPSILPKYRGPAPIPWAIINGEKETGVTTIFMNENVDAGEIIGQKKVDISESDTAGTLGERLANIGSSLVIETLNRIKSGKIEKIVQDENRVSYAPFLSKNMGLINWEKSAFEIHNLVRGLNPWPVAYSYLNKLQVKIYETQIYKNNLDINKNFGKIISIIKKKGFLVVAGEGKLIVSKIQIPGKKIMTVDEYLLGHRIDDGISFDYLGGGK